MADDEDGGDATEPVVGADGDPLADEPGPADDDALEGPRRSTPTIYDVAAACGVAPSTVSRAFSRPGRVNAETAERIRRVAAEMGYRTNPLARALPTGRTSLLAVIVADVTNPFFFEIIRGAEEAATAAGYTLLVADVQESVDAEREALDRTLPLVEGIMLATSRMSDSSIRVAAKQRPTVVLNRIMTDIPSVVTDNARGMRRAVEHLAELGHTTITYVAGPEASWADGMRWRSLREAAYELEIRARRIGPFSPTQAGGIAAAHVFAEQRSSAVVAYNDLLAIGLMRGLTRLGARIPQDVSLVGFDNIFGSDFCTPPLTTVAAPLRNLGGYALTVLLDQLRTPSPRLQPRREPLRPALLPAQLVVRGSTAPRGRRRAWGPSAPARTGPGQSPD
ncbi:LacI family DNA-binding transcriptional regulator [Actinotalea sp. AC32]|nr:LacI family DNA-binding transcriptional regulator [Actinotalea sp. AC32]